jgi:hypothetical protein
LLHTLALTRARHVRTRLSIVSVQLPGRFTNDHHHFSPPTSKRDRLACSFRRTTVPPDIDVHVQGLSHGNSCPEGIQRHGAQCPRSITADCCCCPSLVEALVDNASAFLGTSLLPVSALCCGQKKDGSMITQSVEIRGLQLHHVSCQVPRPRSTATRCMLQVPKVGAYL